MAAPRPIAQQRSPIRSPLPVLQHAQTLQSKSSYLQRPSARSLASSKSARSSLLRRRSLPLPSAASSVCLPTASYACNTRSRLVLGSRSCLHATLRHKNSNGQSIQCIIAVHSTLGASKDADSVTSGHIAESIEALPLPAPSASEPLEASIAESACSENAHDAGSPAPRRVESPDPIGNYASTTETFEAYLRRPNSFVFEATASSSSKRNPRWRATAPSAPATAPFVPKKACRLQ